MFHQSPAVVMGHWDSHISALGSRRGPRCSHTRVPTMRRNASPPLAGSIWTTGKSSRQRCACVRARGLFSSHEGRHRFKGCNALFPPLLFLLLQRFFWSAHREWALCSLDPLLLVMDHCPWAASSVRPATPSFLAFADLTSSFIRVKRIQRGAGWTGGW